MVFFKNSWLKSKIFKIFCCKDAYYRKCPRFENAYYWRQIIVRVLIRDQVGISGRWGPSVSFVSMTRIGLTGCGPPVCTQVHNKRSTGIMGPHALFHALLSGPQTGRINKFKKKLYSKVGLHFISRSLNFKHNFNWITNFSSLCQIHASLSN